MRVADVRAACAGLPTPLHHHVVDIAEPVAAAILVPVIDSAGSAAIVVTKRHGDLRHHGDDWVFPGGRVDPTDASPADAARREAVEELGLTSAQVEVIGRLDTRGPIASGFLVDVFVGEIAADATLRPPTAEVTDLAIVPIDEILGEQRWSWLSVSAAIEAGLIDPATLPSINPDGQLRWFELRSGAHLWGMQADILANLAAHLREHT